MSSPVATNIHTASPIELSKIHVDYGWNGRAARNVQDMAGTESSGFDGFKENIRTTGQIEPVILRNTNGKTLSGQKTDKPFELVVGFRRFKGIEVLNLENGDAKKTPSVPGLPNGTIMATVRDLKDPTEARILNALENTARKNLKAPDLVFIARDLSAKGMNQVPIADALQITQGWVSKLLKVASLPPAVLDHWRDEKPIPAVQTKDGIFELKAGQNGKAVPSRELTEPEMRQLAELKGGPEEITARYIRMVAPATEPGEGPGAAGEKEDKVKEKVQEIASLMGCMVRAGVLDNGSLDWTRVIGPRKKGYPIDCGKDTSQERLLELGDAAQEAFEAEVTKGSKKSA
jgi:hypothetical protein